MTTRDANRRAAASPFLRLAIAAAALVPAAGLIAAPAQAQEDNSLTSSILSGIGLVAPEPPQIDYRERAPLVAPPNGSGELALPPPRDAGAVAANPAWPKDYDAELKKKLQAEDAKVVKQHSRYSGIDPRPLSPSELAKGQRAGKATGSGFDSTTGDNRVNQNELGFTGWGSFSLSSTGEKPLVFTGEPEREALVQPPPGYQTPAPNAPYGVVEDKKKPWSLPNLFDRTQTNKQ